MTQEQANTETPKIENLPSREEVVLYQLWEYYGDPLVDIAKLNNDWFLNTDHSRVAADILNWKAEGKPNDISAFAIQKNALFGQIWVKCSEHMPSPLMFVSYCEEMHHLWLQRQIFKIIEDCTSVFEPEESIAKLRAYLDEIDKKSGNDLDIKDPKLFAGEYIEHLEERKKLKEPEMPTGFPMLDARLWGMNRSEVVTIAARTGRGKSVFMLNVAANLVVKGKRVLYFSTEMSAHEKWSRLVAIMSEIKAWKFRKAHFDLAEWKKITGTAEALHELGNFYVCDKVSPTIEDVKSAIAKVKPDIAILDYLQLFSLPKAERHDLRVAEFMERVKAISRMENIAMLVASQLNRQVDNRDGKIPTLADLKESSSIEQGSDAVILMFDEPGVEAKADVRILNANVEKSRHGPPGLVKLNFFTEKLKMKEIAPE